MVFQVREQRLSVLLWRRAEAPFDGTWALPGGLLEAGERLGASASRHLAAKVDIPQIAHLEQLETRSDPARDPDGTGARDGVPGTRHARRAAEPAGRHRLAPGRCAAADRVRPRLDRRLGQEPAAGQALLHQHRLRARPRDVHHLPAPRHLRRRPRPPRLGHQPAAHPHPQRRHRADHWTSPAPPQPAAAPRPSTASPPASWWSPTPSPPSAPAAPPSRAIVAARPHTARSVSPSAAKTFFISNTFRAHSTNSLREEKTLRDHGSPTAPRIR